MGTVGWPLMRDLFARQLLAFHFGAYF